MKKIFVLLLGLTAIILIGASCDNENKYESVNKNENMFSENMPVNTTDSKEVYESIRSELPHHFVVCFSNEKISCINGECRDLPTNTFNLLAGTRSDGNISRCDKNGCDTYRTIAQQSGIFENVQPVEPMGFIFKRLISEEKHEFVEVVSLGLEIIITSGYCEDVLD